MPGTNFAGNCNVEYYPGTRLLKPCHPLPEDIRTCQEKYGKKVILALGGESGYQLSGTSEGQAFADYLWGAFGPKSANSGQFRPFESSEVDGFDFDIEVPSSGKCVNSISSSWPANNGIDNQAGYVAMINRLRSHFDKELKQYLITGAPQCIVQDKNMGQMIKQTKFDILLVQFYNTPECSARRFVDSGDGMTYKDWTDFIAGTPSANAKIYIGLSAHKNAANKAHYLHAGEVEKLVEAHAGYSNLGGIMLWEATRAEANTQEGGKPYYEVVKDILLKYAGSATESQKTTKAPVNKRPTVASSNKVSTRPTFLIVQILVLKLAAEVPAVEPLPYLNASVPFS